MPAKFTARPSGSILVPERHGVGVGLEGVGGEIWEVFVEGVIA